MAYYANIFLTMCAVYIFAVRAENSYEFITKRPENYPNFDDNAFVKSLVQKKLPRVKRDLNERYCDYNHDGRLCCAEIKDTIPYAIKLRDGRKDLHVVQSQYLKQTIPEVRCKSEGASCFSDLVFTISDVTPKCETIRRDIGILVQDKNLKLMFQYFKVDVACSCVLRKNS